MIIRSINPAANFRAVLDLTKIIRSHYKLIIEMVRTSLVGRHKSQLFGSVWIIIHPLSLTLLYIFLFGIVFSRRIGGTYELPLNFNAYILSGLIPWFTFQAAMNSSVNAITSNVTLVKQFVFPIELLPLRDVFLSLVTWMVMLSITLIYLILSQKVIFITWLLLPIILSIQIMFMIGVAFWLSAISVFFRDIKEIVQLFCMVAIFTMPVVFLPGWVPKVLQPIIWLNPFTYMILVYRDVLYFGRFEHPYAWVVFIFLSLLSLSSGYRLFRKTKPLFANLL